ncbi:hypothetical protein A2U01_0080096 [Trifolium medium]|uniref:Uncharacterized protein n=1 Tax=Trifolium medium TaxID=97028 RepID=A0A392TCH8_9FABA|nr:hypothetical protein [Trifolium medium]
MTAVQESLPQFGEGAGADADGDDDDVDAADAFEDDDASD